MMQVILYSDGSSMGNPGPGGYGTILQYTDSNGKVHIREYSQGYKETTNNRMELMGVIRGLEELNRSCSVKVISDSKYVIDAFNQNWIDGWVKKNFRINTSNPVKNIDLWKKLIDLTKKHEVTFSWVKGHAGHPENERCDELATSAAASGEIIVDEGYLE